MQGVLTPAIELWNFGRPKGLPSPNFGSVSFILTLLQSRVVTQGVHKIMNPVAKDQVLWLANVRVQLVFNFEET